jgi:hypothetical protein
LFRARVLCATAAIFSCVSGCATLLGLDEDRELGSVTGGAAGANGGGGAGGVGGAGQPYVDFVKPHGGVAYFRFDDAPGTDFFENDIDSNHPASKGQSGAVGQDQGVLGMGALFGGSVGSEAGDIHDFAGKASMSVELWVSTPAPKGGVQHLVSKRKGDGDGWAVIIDNDGTVSFTRSHDGTSTNVRYELDDPLDYGRFLHVVGTFSEGSGSRLFVDAVQRGTPPAANEQFLANHGEPLKIGGSSGLFFTGVIDEVALYDRELTVDEIEEHFAMVPL